MAALITRRAGRRLPQGDIQPSALARQLGVRSLFVTGGAQLINLVTRAPAAMPGFTKVDTSRGPAFSNGGSAWFQTSGVFLTQTFSRIAIVSVNAMQTGTISDSRGGGLGGAQWRIESNGELVLNRSNVANIGTSSGAGIVPGRAYAVGVTYDANGTAAFFIDGRAVGGGTSQQAFDFDGSGSLFARGGGGEMMNGAIGMHADFPPMPAAMMRALTRHPRLLLKDISRRLALAVPTMAAPQSSGSGASLSGGAAAVALAYGTPSTTIPLSGAATGSASASGTLTTGAAGSLSMNVVSAGTSTSNLTALGKLDWIVYNSTTPLRKNGSGSLINVAHVGSFSDSLASDSKEASTWSDGAGTVSGSTNNLIFSGAGDGVGYSATFPADTIARIATVIAGVYNTRLRITASLSDSSAVSVVDTSIVSDSSGGNPAIITIPYRAGSDGQFLTVTVVQITPSGYANTSFQAAALSLAATAATLGGAAAAVASGSGSLSTTIPLAGAAQAVAAGAGSPSTMVPLAGAATASASGTGALSTTTPLSGAAATAATANGALVSAVPLSGNASASAAGTGSVTNSSGAGMAGAAIATSSARGAITTSVPLSGAANVDAEASGTLNGGAAILSGAAVVQSTAAGALSTSIKLGGAAQATSSGAGQISTAVPLVGAAAVAAQASGTLASAGTGLSGIAQAGASASGSPTTTVTLAGQAEAHGQAQASVTTSIALGAAAQASSTGGPAVLELGAKVEPNGARMYVALQRIRLYVGRERVREL